MKKIIITITFIFSSIAFSAIETKEFSAKGLKELKLSNTSGDVKVTVSTDGKAHVSANKVKFEKGCSLVITRSNDELVVKVEKKVGRVHCEVDFDIKVPKSIELSLEAGSGTFEVNDTVGEVDIKLGSGSAKVNAQVTELDARSGSGSIEVKGLTGDADARTGSGDVLLSYTSIPKKAEIDIKTGSGDATVYLPKAAKVSTDFKVGSGQLNSEFDNTPDASVKLSMKAGSGNLNIRKLK